MFKYCIFYIKLNFIKLIKKNIFKIKIFLLISVLEKINDKEIKDIKSTTQYW